MSSTALRDIQGCMETHCIEFEGPDSDQMVSDTKCHNLYGFCRKPCILNFSTFSPGPWSKIPPIHLVIKILHDPTADMKDVPRSIWSTIGTNYLVLRVRV